MYNVILLIWLYANTRGKVRSHLPFDGHSAWAQKMLCEVSGCPFRKESNLGNVYRVGNE